MVTIPLPEGSRALHIGPSKTGTTALQDAMHQAREDMREQGVKYVDKGRHDAAAARWAVSSHKVILNRDGAARRWGNVVKQMRSEKLPRRIFSSEALSAGSDEHIERIYGEIGTEGTYLIVTLRPLAKLLSSQYQQGLVNGTQTPFLPWLDKILNQPLTGGNRRFWTKHQHDELIRRWGEPLGFDNVIAVVLDEKDFSFAPHAFEEFLGLSEGTLADREVIPNRSFTWPEAEMMREFNERFKETGFSREVYAQVVASAQRSMKSRVPEPEEAKILTPTWAVDRCNEIGAEIAERIASLGIHVMGDLSSLSRGKGFADVAPPVDVPASVAGRFAVDIGSAMASLRYPDPT